MKIIWNEYAGVLLGVTALVMISKLVGVLIAPGGVFYDAVIGFSNSIC